MQFFDNSGNNYSTEENQNTIQNVNDQDNGVDVNKQNSAYYEKLMKENSSNRDTFYDKDNKFIKLILLVLGAFIIMGTIYIIGRGM